MRNFVSGAAVGSALVSLAFVVFALLVNTHAQEQPVAGERRGNRCFNGRWWVDCGSAEVPAKPPHITRTWMLLELTYRDWTAGRVDVVDTEGACLYVAARSGENIAIAAVPKTQLPKGTGCQ